MNFEQIDEADDEWLDLEKSAAPSQVKADAEISLTVRSGRFVAKVQPKVRATIWLRRDAAQWIEKHGPRFKVQVGGPGCNMLRIVPDLERGQFEAAELKGVRRLLIGVVNVWPNEIRLNVEAKWKITPGGLVLTLPENFAKAGQGEVPTVPPPVAPPEPRKAPGGVPITTAAPGLARVSRPVSIMGEPDPSRSALGQKGGRNV
jgi:hypothetical protein